MTEDEIQEENKKNHDIQVRINCASIVAGVSNSAVSGDSENKGYLENVKDLYNFVVNKVPTTMNVDK